MIYIKDSEGEEITIDYVGASALQGCPLCQLFLAATVSEQPLDPKDVEVNKQIRYLKNTFRGLEVGFGVRFYVPESSDISELVTPLRMQVVAHVVDENGEGMAYTRNFVIESSLGKCCRMILFFFYVPLSFFCTELTRFVVDNPAASQIGNRPRRFDPASANGMKVAKRWIATCQKDHINCPKYTSSALPDRVIEVFEGDDNPDSTPKARLSIGTDRFGQYAALSYIWGGPQPVVTTTQNIQFHFQELPFSDLGLTIQDAIRVTAGLGLRYLWVDSLCIIQDSKQDKAEQITNMKRVFEKAFITIIAASAPSAAAGFLREQPLHSTCMTTLPYWCDDGRVGSIDLKERRAWESRREPIHSRAWPLEEKLLSCRQLIYSSQHLSWECRSRTLYDPSVGDRHVEKYPLALTKYWSIMSLEKSRAIDLNLPQLRGEVLKEWREVVTWYSGRKMTEEADKLRAIGGLAESFQGALDIVRSLDAKAEDSAKRQSYFAGFWIEDFPWGLLWHRRAIADDNDLLPSAFLLQSAVLVVGCRKRRGG